MLFCQKLVYYKKLLNSRITYHGNRSSSIVEVPETTTSSSSSTQKVHKRRRCGFVQIIGSLGSFGRCTKYWTRCSSMRDKTAANRVGGIYYAHCCNTLDNYNFLIKLTSCNIDFQSYDWYLSNCIRLDTLYRTYLSCP